MPPKRKTAAAAAAAAAPPATPLDGFVVAVQGVKNEADVKDKIVALGGKLAARFSKTVTHLITTAEEVSNGTGKVKSATDASIHIVSEDWLKESEKTGNKADEASFGFSSTKRKADDAAAAAAAAAPAPAAAKGGRGKRAKADPPAAAAAAPAPAPAAAGGDAGGGGGGGGKKVQLVKKGKAPVDQCCKLVGSAHVIEDGNEVYNCMLNQTNITGGRNNNKFYVIQALESDAGGKFYCFTRWGRVGEDGQQALMELFSKEGAIDNFEKKFKEKTKNNWRDRANFVPHNDKYTLIEIDYGDEEEAPKKGGGAAAAASAAPKAPVTRKESTLPPSVQNLVRLIFDMKMMTQTLVQLEFDVEKCPLGKLKKSTILKGYEVLQKLEAEIKSGSRDSNKIGNLSGTFYTLIPHSYSRSQRPPPIATEEMLKQKMQMLEALADIEIATTLIQESEGQDSDASLLDLNYSKLKCKISPVTDEGDLNAIRTYVKNSWESGTPDIVSVYKIEREGEAARFAARKSLGNRKMLWHGSRLTNYVGIISQGLRIAPPEAPCSGYRFGKGVYFADMGSLSERYCRAFGSRDFCMLLADVALGREAQLPRDQFMTSPLPGTDSSTALGTILPDPMGNVDRNGCVWPLGKLAPSGYKNVSCREFQYVTYTVEQVNLQYLIHFNGRK